MFSRAPSNQVVHSIPRESSSTRVPGPREVELEVVGDRAPEALGLVDRDAVQRGVALAAERSRQPRDVRRLELRRGRRPGEFDVRVSDH